MTLNNLYIFLTKVYTKIFSFFDKTLLKHKNIDFKEPIVKFINISKTPVNYEKFDKIRQNKYLIKYLFPENNIFKLIKEIFINNNLYQKISEKTGYNYSISFFTAYETYKLSDIDSNSQWYANEFHKDKPYSNNMIKIFFSFEEINENNGPMEIKCEKIYKATMSENEVILFSPNKFLHRATSPQTGKRFQMMFQLNPSNKWNVNKKIYYKQKKIEPKFPFFSYFFDKTIDLEKL